MATQIQRSEDYFSKSYYDRFNSRSTLRRLFIQMIDRKEPVFSWMKRRFPEGSQLLDFGCGNGLFLNQAERYFKSVGVDSSKEAVRRTQELTSQSQVILGDETALSQFGEESFDVITAFDVFEHLSEPEFVWLEMHRLLARNGWLVLSVPQAESTMLSWRQENWWGFEDASHQWLLHSWEWEGWLQRNGFVPIRVWPMGFINHPSPEFGLTGWQTGLHYVTQALSLAGVRLPRQWSDVILIVAVKNPRYSSS